VLKPPIQNASVRLFPMQLKFTPYQPLIMGILNITPDSFSGDGLLAQKDYLASALDQAIRMHGEGADILDVGGESSRPGAEPVSAEEEMRRVIPVVEAIKQKLPHVSIAVDTVKASVAEAALKAGATIINDISALAHDPKMAAVIADSKAYVVLMDNRSNASAVTRDAKVGGEYKASTDGDIAGLVKRDLLARAEVAKKSGIAQDKIILDPGISFGKTLEQNLALLNHIDELKKVGYPVLSGPSRKSFIGRALDLTVDERLEGTAACVAASVMRGADIIRVHDVKFMARVARMAGLIAQN